MQHPGSCVKFGSAYSLHPLQTAWHQNGADEAAFQTLSCTVSKSIRAVKTSRLRLRMLNKRQCTAVSKLRHQWPFDLIFSHWACKRSTYLEPLRGSTVEEGHSHLSERRVKTCGWQRPCGKNKQLQFGSAAEKKIGTDFPRVALAYSGFRLSEQHLRQIYWIKLQNLLSVNYSFVTCCVDTQK